MPTGPLPCIWDDNFRSYVFTDPATVSPFTVSFYNDENDDNGPALNRGFYVGITVRSSNLPTVTCTYDGVAMTQSEALTHTTGGSRLHVIDFYMLNIDLPTTGALYDLVVTVTGTGGTFHEIIIGGGTGKNLEQEVPDPTTSTFVASGPTIALGLTKPTDHFVAMTVGYKLGGATFSHDNNQQEIYDTNGTDISASSMFNIDPGSIATAFESTASTGTEPMIKIGNVWGNVFDTNVYFAATVTATSELFVEILVPVLYSTTIAAVSASTADLQRDRGYVTSLAVTSTVTSDVVRLVDFFGSLTESATVVSPTFKKDSALRALVPVVSTVTGFFGATRPLASLTTVTSLVEAQFGSNFAETTTSLTPGCYIELFEVDTTVIGGGDVFRFVPHGYDVSNVFWQGEEYIRFPVEIEGFEWNATSQAPPQPSLRLSNVNKFVLGAVLTLGDLVGAKVTRWRTYIQFLDNQPQADPNAHFPPDIFYIQQKTSHNKIQIEWTLSSALDLPGIRLPRRQVLRDDTTGNLYAPGVSQVRFRGR